MEKMPNKNKLDFDVKRYLVAEVLYPDHVVPLHVGECLETAFNYIIQPDKLSSFMLFLGI